MKNNKEKEREKTTKKERDRERGRGGVDEYFQQFKKNKTKKAAAYRYSTSIARASCYSERGAPGVKAADGETRRRGAPFGDGQ